MFNYATQLSTPALLTPAVPNSLPEFTPPSGRQLSENTTRELILSKLSSDGYCLLRDFDSSCETFSAMMRGLCSEVTYDPARETLGDRVQKVDAGVEAIGLHIENGNTPNIPQIAAFHCTLAARSGSATTVCDGAALLEAFDPATRDYFSHPITVTRRLPEAVWKAYLARELPGNFAPADITTDHAESAAESRADISVKWHDDSSLTLGVTFDPIRTRWLSDRSAFANALLGPSFNYDRPIYTFEDGSEVSRQILANVADLAETLTHEIPWQDGDIAILDNWRVMHGRRAILDAGHRELFISLGNF